MLKHPNNGLLYRSSLALVNFKGGAGKTVLAGNLASIAARIAGWKVCVIDLDASAPLTRLAFNAVPLRSTVREALALAAEGSDFSEILRFAPNLGFWILPGSLQGVGSEEVRHLPQLVAALCASYFAGGYVDLVIVDTPGENKLVNGAVLASVEHIAMPLALNATDMTATAVTISFVRQMQARRGGRPIFLGLIPNRIQRGGTYERAFLEQVLQASPVLPYIPDSNIIRGSFARAGQDGGETPIFFAPRSAATQRLVRLFEALNSAQRDFQTYAAELRAFLGLESAETPEASA
jgi:cellulose biosynthesis protein BcsQ